MLPYGSLLGHVLSYPCLECLYSMVVMCTPESQVYHSVLGLGLFEALSDFEQNIKIFIQYVKVLHFEPWSPVIVTQNPLKLYNLVCLCSLVDPTQPRRDKFGFSTNSI